MNVSGLIKVEIDNIPHIFDDNKLLLIYPDEISEQDFFKAFPVCSPNLGYDVVYFAIDKSTTRSKSVIMIIFPHCSRFKRKGNHIFDINSQTPDIYKVKGVSSFEYVKSQMMKLMNFSDSGTMSEYSNTTYYEDSKTQESSTDEHSILRKLKEITGKEKVDASKLLLIYPVVINDITACDFVKLVIGSNRVLSTKACCSDGTTVVIIMLREYNRYDGTIDLFKFKKSQPRVFRIVGKIRWNLAKDHFKSLKKMNEVPELEEQEIAIIENPSPIDIRYPTSDEIYQRMDQYKEFYRERLIHVENILDKPGMFEVWDMLLQTMAGSLNILIGQLESALIREGQLNAKS